MFKKLIKFLIYSLGISQMNESLSVTTQSFPVVYCPPTFSCPENVTSPNNDCDMVRPHGMEFSTLLINPMNTIPNIPKKWRAGQYNLFRAASFITNPDPNHDPNKILTRCYYRHSTHGEAANIGVYPVVNQWVPNYDDPKNVWSEHNQYQGRECMMNTVEPEDRSEQCPFYSLK